MKTPKQVVTRKPMISTGPKHPSMFRRIPWQDVCKFLAGAFFVNAGILFYLYLARVSVPLLGTNFIETPEISGMRSIVRAVLFLTLRPSVDFMHKVRPVGGAVFVVQAGAMSQLVEQRPSSTSASFESGKASRSRARIKTTRRCEDEKPLQPPSVRPLDKSVSKASRIFRRFVSLETSPFVGISFF